MTRRTERALFTLWLAAVATGFGCGPYFESAQFGWTTVEDYGPTTESSVGQLSAYVEQLLPGSSRSTYGWSDPLPGADLPLEEQAEGLRAYLARPAAQHSRGTAVRRLALIDALGAAYPDDVAAFIRAPDDPAALLPTSPLVDFAALGAAWREYLRANHAGVLAIVSDRLAAAPDSPAAPHLRYVLARAEARLDPEREVDLFASYLEREPGSPWAADARGWLAHGLLHQGRDAEALAEYAGLCEDPAAAYLHPAARRSIAHVLALARDRGALDAVIDARPWLRAATDYFDTYRRLRNERDAAKGAAEWTAFAERVLRDLGVEPPYRAIELAAIHTYEDGDYGGAIRLWETIPPDQLTTRSERYYGIALAAHGARTESASLDLAERMRSSRELSESSRRWIYGEMGRRLLERDRKIDAAIAFHRGGFTYDWQALVDTTFNAREIGQLAPRAREVHPEDWADEIDTLLGRQLAREGRYDDAAKTLPAGSSTAAKARAIADLVEAYERSPSADGAYRVAEAFYAARPLLQREQYVGWRAGFPLGYQRLGLTDPSFGRANNYATALEWFDHVREGWPDDPLAADALYWSAVCAFWTSDLDWYWSAMGRDGAYWGDSINPRFIEDGAGRLREFLDEHPDHALAAEADRRLVWAEGLLEGGR